MDKEKALARFREALEYLKDNGKARSQTDMAALIGVRQPHLASAINGDYRRFTEGFLKRFAKAYSDYINETWLLTGEGKMEKPREDMRPHYPATVAAGALGGISEAIMGYEAEMEPAIRQLPDYDFTIDVSGPSMEPTYFDGDVVACRSISDSSELSSGRTYVFDTRDGAVLKRFVSLGKSSLRVASDNPDFKPYSIDLDSVISISEVVGSLRNEQNARFAEWLKDYSTRSV